MQRQARRRKRPARTRSAENLVIRGFTKMRRVASSFACRGVRSPSAPPVSRSGSTARPVQMSREAAGFTAPLRRPSIACGPRRHQRDSDGGTGIMGSARRRVRSTAARITAARASRRYGFSTRVNPSFTASEADRL